MSRRFFLWLCCLCAQWICWRPYIIDAANQGGHCLLGRRLRLALLLSSSLQIGRRRRRRRGVACEAVFPQHLVVPIRWRDGWLLFFFFSCSHTQRCSCHCFQINVIYRFIRSPSLHFAGPICDKSSLVIWHISVSKK